MTWKPGVSGNPDGAKKRREFEQRVRAAIEQDDWKRVRQGIETVLDLCATGERWALELVRDTLDGKPKQQIEAVDDQGRTLAVALIAYAQPETENLVEREGVLRELPSPQSGKDQTVQ